MSMLVTGRFDCLIQAEEAMSESLLRFPREDVALVPPRSNADASAHGTAERTFDRLRSSAFVMIRAADANDRRIAERTLQGRGAVEVDVRMDLAAAHRRRIGRAVALV